MRYILLFAILILSSCSQSESSQDTMAYADLKGFFETEIARLEKMNPEVYKTVARNKASETRSVGDINWKTELSLFSESDINKPAWKNSYKVLNQSGKTIYLASDSSLRTREISIDKDGDGKISKIKILNYTQNMLYTSTEQLTYIPDSLYQISKQQHVLLIGNNRYYIKGIL